LACHSIPDLALNDRSIPQREFHPARQNPRHLLPLPAAFAPDPVTADAAALIDHLSGGIYSDVDENGITYRVRFSLAGNPDGGPNVKTLRVKVGLQEFTTPLSTSQILTAKEPKPPGQRWAGRTRSRNLPPKRLRHAFDRESG
jgi:hypothetical protein